MTDDLGDRLANAIDRAATPVEPAEAMHRGKRQARRRATVVACITVIAMAAAGVAVASATTGSSSGRQRIHVTNPPVVIDRTWCVAVSRHEAIIRALDRETVDHGTLRAKLVSEPEVFTRTRVPGSIAVVAGPLDPAVPVTKDQRFWVIELRRTRRTMSPYTSELMAFDANRGDLVAADVETETQSNLTAGEKPPPPYFETLPDHSSDCRSDSSTTSTISQDAH